MAGELRFDGKVVLITGAGGGLGRAHALLFGARGAKVLVNDLGGSTSGEGKSTSAADKVVDEIKALGGRAAANYDSVEQGDKIVQAALDHFGRIDVVINNAGILRDTSFHKMSEDDWDLVYRVHVKGAFKVTHAAWPRMRDQKYGRVIFTASAAGLYGNFGQVNYAMAKLGLLGMSYALAVEGRKNGVFVNTIAPIAASRMTETVLPPDLLASLKPELVSPLVAWLAHESSEETGGIFEVGGGYVGKLRWNRTLGRTWRIGRAVTPEDVRGAWSTIGDWSKSHHPASVTEALGPIFENVKAGPAKGGNEFIDVDEALGAEEPPVRAEYTERDVALYALGVGAGQAATDPAELQLVYELNGAGFHPLPTMTAAMAVGALTKNMIEGKRAAGLRYGVDRILHGEQSTEIVRPLRIRDRLEHRNTIKAIYDKGKGAVVVSEIRSYDAAGELVAINEATTFVRGAGGWGGDRGPSADAAPIPDRAPDAVVEEKTSPDQALLYRLSGDVNPLHADPGFAQAFGFDRPILHGLCTYGFAARHVIKAMCGGDPRLLRTFRARFVDPVFPGETIVTEIWKTGPGQVLLRSSVKERAKVVLANGAAGLHKDVPKESSPARSANAAPPPAASAEPASADIFAGIAAYVRKNAEATAKIGKVFQFRLSSPSSVWTLDLPGGAVGEGETKKPDTTLELDDADFIAMCTGKADAMKLFSSGKLKISGDLMASQKLELLRKVDPNDVIAAMRARLGAPGAPGPGAPGPSEAPAPAAPTEPASSDIFAGIAAYVRRNADATAKIGKVFQFKLSSPSSVWTLDLPGGVVGEGETRKPDTTLELDDADFIAMCTGKADAMKLFSSGKLKISGDLMASQKLELLRKVDPNDVISAMKARLGAPAASAAPTAAGAPGPAAGSASPSGDSVVAEGLFKKAEAALRAQPGLAQELGGDVSFRVGERRWTVTATGSVTSNGAASTVITISDAALERWSRGERTAASLYQRGELRVDGELRVARRLDLVRKLFQ